MRPLHEGMRPMPPTGEAQVGTALMTNGDRPPGEIGAGIELRHLRALIAIADELHFGHAADRLRLSQSTLSRTLADLEQQLGVRLVERTQRTRGLTPAGRSLAATARTALEGIETGVQTVRAERTRAPVLGIVHAVGHRYVPALRRELRARRAPEPVIRRIDPSR
jgi:DNA-binding transcriptional LysR family regulator